MTLRSSSDPAEYRRAAQEEAPLEVWMKVIADYPDYRQWVAHNKTVPLEVLDLLTTSCMVVVGAQRCTGPEARYPAVPMLLNRLAANALVVLDDARRADERAIGERWAIAFDGFSLEWLDHDHGTLLLRRGEGDAAECEPEDRSCRARIPHTVGSRLRAPLVPVINRPPPGLCLHR